MVCAFMDWRMALVANNLMIVALLYHGLNSYLHPKDMRNTFFCHQPWSKERLTLKYCPFSRW